MPLVGEVSATCVGQETWVGDRHLGYLKHGSALVSGRWHRHQDRWAFQPERPEQLAVLAGQQEFEVLDGYWGERAVLVLDRNMVWTRHVWQEEDGDHDHCAICWAKIAAFAEQEYYGAATPAGVVCVSCFQNYVSQSSLDFIQG